MDEWRSGGDRSLSALRNCAFYAHRFGQLVGLLERHSRGVDLRILDAGCGKGWLTDQLARLGHRMVGVDPSDSAIKICRATRSGRFVRTTLDGVVDRHGFDVVICMDVLFHILDDAVWDNSLSNLAACLRMEGALIVTDYASEERVILGDYIVHRPLGETRGTLARYGLRLVETLPYRFSGNPNAFLVFRHDAAAGLR
ncbi:MAG TPA: methyltransferase domain-containing protein [Woeseiaceae bacterium]|nr:methyltransferase domain-containing protein [Woeseiaceae bacterium]